MSIFLKLLGKLGGPARPEKSSHPVRIQTAPHSKKDICLYKNTPQIPAGSSNHRIRSWIASLSRSILIRYVNRLWNKEVFMLELVDIGIDNAVAFRSSGKLTEADMTLVLSDAKEKISRYGHIVIGSSD